MAYWKRCHYFGDSPRKEKSTMALTTARKKANAKYEAKAYDKTLIRLPKGRLDEIRAHIQPAGESLNGFVNRAISETIERDTSPQPTESPVRAANPLASIINPDTLRAAQAAAKATGEDMPAFMTRSIDWTVQHDKAAWSIGCNPVTGEDVTKGGKQHE